MKTLNIGRHEVLVDDQDHVLVSQYRWRVCFQAGTKKVRGVFAKKEGLSMHRLIMGASEHDPFVDHRNRNPLDNRRENLRFCSPAQNQWNKGRQSNNTSGFKGVYFDSRKCRWRARIRVYGRRTSLGSHASPEEASQAYAEAAAKFHGNFACAR